MIPFQIDVMHAQQDIITNSEVHRMMPALVPVRLMLLQSEHSAHKPIEKGSSRLNPT